jgi:cytochrome b561
MSSARSFSVSWFGLVTLPDLIGPNRSAYSLLHETHEFLANVLFYVAIIHALAALKHHFIDKDNVLRRMLPVKLRDETK